MLRRVEEMRRRRHWVMPAAADPRARPRDRAWIAPDGTIYDLAGVPGHKAWAVRNGVVVTDSRRGCAAATCSLSMLRLGWIRQAWPDTYETTADHRSRILAHVRRTYPEIEAIYVDEWIRGRRKSVRLWVPTGEEIPMTAP